MSSSPVDYINSLLINFGNPNNDERAAAETTFNTLLTQDPNQVIIILLEIVKSSPNVNCRIQALIQIKNYLFRVESMNSTLTLSPNTYSCLKQVFGELLNFGTQRDPREQNYIFLIIDQIIVILSSNIEWPEIFDLMFRLLQTPLSFKSIRFFANYISSANPEQIPQQLLASLSSALQFDSQYPEARSASLNLAYNLMILDNNLLGLFNFIPQVILSLPDQNVTESLSDFLYFFQLHGNILGSHLEQFTAALLNIIQNTARNDASRISSLETISRMLDRSPPVWRFISSHLGDFAQSIVVALANPYDEFGERSAVYNYTCQLLEDFVSKDPKSGKQLLQIVTQNSQQIPLQSLSAVIRWIPQIDLLPQIIQLLQHNDLVIFENAVYSLDYLIHHKLSKIISKDKSFPTNIVTLLFQLISQGKIIAVAPLARFVEEISDIDKGFLKQIAPTLLQLIQSINTSDSIRCAAAIIDEAPPIALQFAGKALEMIVQGADADTCYTLMIAISKFAKVMDEQNLGTLIQHLLSLTQIRPEVSTWLGLRIIAKQIGPPFAQFLQFIVPKLLEVSNQEIEVFVQEKDDTNWQDSFEYSSIFVPGKNKMMLFRNEQFAEITSALQSLGDYALAVKEAFTPYFEESFKAAMHSIAIVFDSQIRMAGVELLTDLAISVKGHIFEILQQLINEFPQEPEIEVQAKIAESISSLVENSDCPNEAKLLYFQTVPALLKVSFELLRSSIQNDEFESCEEDLFLNLLWAFLTSLKPLYDLFPDQALNIFTQITSLLKPLSEETIPLLIQFSLGLWIDFLIICPIEFIAQCGNVLQQILTFVNSPDVSSRRMALFGVGRIYERLNLNSQQLDEILNILFNAVNTEEATENESFYAGNDNAVSSYSILLKQRLNFGNAAEAVSKFIHMFPAEDDIEEAQIGYMFLFQLFCQAQNNNDIAPFVQEIAEKLFQGMQIPNVANAIGPEIRNLASQMQNIPPYVSQFLSQLFGV
ncbi:hypothetical protein GPJ56_005319 [Histomonas meleagridis]|uniref:uncharacterized protein n=1 Tax=Histomonas meleagridis TaxID=135588 RepID=UPI00355A92FE|nr:hypothetical protein GPJ56_005319 [Histomonas meleagridis]KAH0796299.1 hypothetical protein GO595_010192 [Histomonas meleagridis]